MIKRTELAQYLQELLCVSKYTDYAPNGIQVEGNSIIKRICTAVTASEEVIAQAAQWQADALIVHHGYFWRGEDPVLRGMKRQRIASLINNNINLFAYHLPLDCHLDLGNNACLGRLFRAQSITTHKIGNIEHLLWSGELEQPVAANEFSHYLETQLSRKPLHISGNNKLISSIAWCSGGAQDYIEDAYHLGVDAYISGEVSERTYYQAKELGIHYYACGHHATERYGIQALGEYLSVQFHIENLFLDSFNPI